MKYFGPVLQFGAVVGIVGLLLYFAGTTLPMGFGVCSFFIGVSSIVGMCVIEEDDVA